MSIKEVFKAETQRLGFPLSGVMQITSPNHFDTYQRWLDGGFHAGMAYLATVEARARRANPVSNLPTALTLLVVAMRYPSPLAIEDSIFTKDRGRVASYAWRNDYHIIIPHLLEELVETLQKYLGQPVQSRSYTDTGPILERDYAQQSGLGWAGKNTCLISPQHGSYFLLGETFIDVEIEPDQPFIADHCGTCRRCIDACPTGAICSDRTIDSGQCISYLTIENKGTIPVDLRPKIGNWIFGCDLCQIVCPWNLRFSTPQGHSGLTPDPEKAAPFLINELSLAPQQFNQKYRHSPILRAKRRGYLRNVVVALGNQCDTDSIPALTNVLENEREPLVRSHAAWALGCMHTPLSCQALHKAYQNDPDPTVRAEIQFALAHK